MVGIDYVVIWLSSVVIVFVINCCLYYDCIIFGMWFCVGIMLMMLEWVVNVINFWSELINWFLNWVLFGVYGFILFVDCLVGWKVNLYFLFSILLFKGFFVGF